MTLRIRRLSLRHFRKFRDSITLDGLCDGLNIIAESNETGKSTMLEALRAALFVRCSARNQLTKSYMPYGDSVAPEVDVAFDVNGRKWEVRKRFLKSPSVEVNGPDGRAQGEEAEEQLYTLLGAEKDTSSKGDLNAAGILGMLWIGQAEALSLAEPGTLARDTVRSVLEAEVGAVMGGPAWSGVRERIEKDYSHYWTATGRETGELTAARQLAEQATAEAAEAKERLRQLNNSFMELEQTRAELTLLRRDLDDDSEQARRKELMAKLETARQAKQILETRQVAAQSARQTVATLDEMVTRHRTAVEAHRRATAERESIRQKLAVAQDDLQAAQAKECQTRQVLEAAREARKTAQAALKEGQARSQALRVREAVRAAKERHARLVVLEQRMQEADVLLRNDISEETIAKLDRLDRKVAEMQVRTEAGAAMLSLSGDLSALRLNGASAEGGDYPLVKALSIEVGGARIDVRPPASAMRAAEDLREARQRLADALDEAGVPGLADARARREQAREAAAQRRTLVVQIEALTPAVPDIGLSAGPEALHLFVKTQTDDAPDHGEQEPDLAALTAQLEQAESAAAQAEGAHSSAVTMLRKQEEATAPLKAAEAGALRDEDHARALIAEIEGRPDFDGLEERLIRAQEKSAEAAVQLEEAGRHALAYDEPTIQKQIGSIDRTRQKALDERNGLEKKIAGLEARIESEGGKGLAERSATACEEAEAAAEALRRTELEARTIRLLRNTLEEARAETSARFVGPVVRRVQAYADRLMPDCELTFTENLCPQTVKRDGTDEDCGFLSRGTQEQLAVLTRIAFADILLEKGLPVSLILDDPLVWSDDLRLEQMLTILSEVSQRMQVILFTCRHRAFRHLEGHRVMLSQQAA